MRIDEASSPFLYFYLPSPPCSVTRISAKQYHDITFNIVPPAINPTSLTMALWICSQSSNHCGAKIHKTR